jgi:hypothetical protein
MELLLTKTKYTNLWKQIESASLSSNRFAWLHVAGQTFWAALEDELGAGQGL